MPHWLTPVCDDQPVSQPIEPVRAVAEPAVQGRHVAGPQRPLEHDLGDAVELHEHDAGHVGDGRRAGAPAGAAGRALVEPGVVVEGEQRCSRPS